MIDQIKLIEKTPPSSQDVVPSQLHAEAQQAFVRTAQVDTTPTTNAPPADLDWGTLSQSAPFLPPTDAQPAAPTAPTQAAPVETGANDSTVKKIGREALVVGGATGESMLNGLANLPEKIPEITAGIAAGATLNAITKAGDLGLATSFVIGGYFASRWILNTIKDKERWQTAGGALSDAWNSNQHVKTDINNLSKSAGDYAFDTGLGVASGYLGYQNKQLGDLVLNVLHIPILAPSVGIAPALLGANMYLDIMPALAFHDDGSGDGQSHSTNLNFNLNGNIGWTTGIGKPATTATPAPGAAKPGDQSK